MPDHRITVRRRHGGERILFIIGPGGVGKSTLGKWLAAGLGRSLIDLDEQFCSTISPIGEVIRRDGSDAYYRANSELAQSLLDDAREPVIFVTSSGFLSADSPPAVRRANHDLILSGYSISLLPSLDLQEATRIVVERQLARGFGLDRENEERKFRERLAIYREHGDMLVIAPEITDEIATAICAALGAAVR